MIPRSLFSHLAVLGLFALAVAVALILIRL